MSHLKNANSCTVFAILLLLILNPLKPSICFSQPTARTFRIASQSEYAQLRNATFGPGDSILFERGKTYLGQFRPRGSGLSGAPIIIDCYGSGDKPVIDGNNSRWGTLFFDDNNQYWEISNLHIRNGDTEFHKNGIFFSGDSPTAALRHIYITNCHIDRVGGWGIKIASGETWSQWRVTANTRYDDIRIKGNTVIGTAHRGISLRNAYCTIDEPNHNGQTHYSNIKKWFTNVVIDSNYIEDSRSDAIVVWGAIRPRITRNIIRRAGYGGTGNGMFVSFVDGALIEHNEVSGTQHDPRDKDAGGIDLDYFNFNAVCQYNYVHDNAENGIIIIGSQKDSAAVYNAVIRYNISARNWDGSAKSGEVRISGRAKWAKIYNNVFYTNENSTADMILLDGSAPQDSMYWFNNIFYHNGTGGYAERYEALSDSAAWARHRFRNNCFYGFHPAGEPGDPSKITGDPRLKMNNPEQNPDTSTAFQVQQGSSCIGSGVRFYYGFPFHTASRDFYGNPVPQDSLDIGIHEVEDRPEE